LGLEELKILGLEVFGNLGVKGFWYQDFQALCSLSAYQGFIWLNYSSNGE
jgi:hypothetical protein